MKERGILFSGPMVRAILEGTKTQTRRIVKGMALDWLSPDRFTPEFVASPDNDMCPYGLAGDRLWVRETWQIADRSTSGGDGGYALAWRATDENLDVPATWVNGPQDDEEKWKVTDTWRPSLFMPRWASRITLEIVSIRIEKLQDISEEDAKAEGVEPVDVLGCDNGYRDYGCDIGGVSNAKLSFKTLWQSINGEGSWNENPWVWVITFKKL